MWYKTGTINLIANNATVNGTGTAWADAKFGVMPGMILLAPDNKLYEVKQVNSNISLTLNSNYAGSTASGQSYAIITTYEGDISQFSARFAAMLTFFQGSRNDTVSWFTGSGDMTFTKDDGTKLTVPTLAKIQSDYVSTSKTTEQRVSSDFVTTQGIRAVTSTRVSGSSQLNFIPSSAGAWITWYRGNPTATDNFSRNATEFINMRGAGTVGAGNGGFNFWNSSDAAISHLATIDQSGNGWFKGGVTSEGSITSKGEVTIAPTSASASNAVMRFRNQSGTEVGCIFSNLTDGAINFRNSISGKSVVFRQDDFLVVPGALTTSQVYQTAASVPDVGITPFLFRGSEYGGLGKPNTISMATPWGFSIVSTAATNLGPGVARGTSVFYVDARSGQAGVLNDFFISNKKAIKDGDYGITQSVTDEANVDLDGLYYQTFNKIVRPPINGPVDAIGSAYFLDVRSWAVDGGKSIGNTRAIQTLYGYGNSGADVGKIWTRAFIGSTGWTAWKKIWTETNTTADSNGFIKKASPIARLSSNPEKMSDEYLDGFTLSGLAAVNGEAAGVTAERVSVGVYKVTGSLGFALEGWNIEVPQDVNGNRLCFVATEAAEDGTITVKVSKRRFDIDTAAIVAGEPMDIPEGRWIDLRLEMPPVEEVQSEPEPESHEGEMASE
ncbi:pyocin knob domain-containing protein [Serratia fonticola]|uniref:pyocin knob domain-containing protein n=1 Tax=Serratia fonticola TaxID=47917 RepID=UPI00217BB785|nr:pyocin knob domain-containing protein [Serratia fonticola]CAI1501191.1 Uncharacterised protein [Serratia fonticola]